VLAAHRFCVAGGAITVNVAEGFSRFTVSVPVVLPAGMVPEQVTPGGKLVAVFEGQLSVTAAENPLLGVKVMVEVVVDTDPAAPAVVVTVALLALIVKVPPEFTVKVTLFEMPPPGAGFCTVTAGVPAVAISEARMEAVSWVALTKVVVFANPPKLTTAAETKFVPFTVRVNAGPPAVALGGESVVIVGTGLLPWVIVKPGGFKFVSGPPPGCGVNRSIGTPGAGTAVVKSESGSFTVKEVGEQAVMFDLTAPLKRTTVALAPPQMIDPPLTMSEKLVVPDVTVVGLMELITGMGFKIVKGTPFVGFSCAGSVTVTVADAPFTN
jgi:hypothetical protein